MEAAGAAAAVLTVPEYCCGKNPPKSRGRLFCKLELNGKSGWMILFIALYEGVDTRDPWPWPWPINIAG